MTLRRLFLNGLIPLFLLLALAIRPATSQQQLPPFFAGGTYDPSTPTPESFLGFPIGQRPARYHEVIGYIKVIAGKSNRVRLFEMGTTYEDRPLYYLAISAPENIARLEEIKVNNRRLADPRDLARDAARAIVASQPVVVWAEYAIHGDEISSVDAALQVIYQLAAGTDATTSAILKELIVCIDPIVNPDGRERFLSQMEQWNGAIPSTDIQSFHHTGNWPGGRGNHYLFDMNRDWFILAHPEMQARAGTIVGWNPQLMIDSHEMGSTDTYLFHPPREPLNPNISPVPLKWWKSFSADQAKAFDRYGWSYYTREWNDDWYPGYGSSWGLYTGAIGILYEQAGVDGTIVKRPDGTTMTYRESVHHHFTSTMANLSTASRNRKEILTDYTEDRRSVSADPDAETYYIVRGPNRSRVDRLLSRLHIMGIEVRRLDRDATISSLTDPRGTRVGSKKLPAGTLYISCAQPMGRYARAILEFDPRMKTSFLEEERKSLEKEKDSKLYDNTAWSLLLANNLEAYVSTQKPPVAPIWELPSRHAATLENENAGFGFVIDYADDGAVDALAMLLQQGIKVRSAKEPFGIDQRSYSRGSLVLRKNENQATLVDALKKVAEQTGTSIVGVNTALSTSGPDLGGNDMVLLSQPRPVVVTGPEFSGTSFGAVWYLFDQKLKMTASIVNTNQLAFIDLRRYNVLILPSANSQSLSRALGKSGITRLREWMENGGTLIAIEGAAAFAADTSTGWSAVRLRTQALKELDLFSRAAETERRGSDTRIDSTALWEGKIPARDSARAEKTAPPDEKALAYQEERARMFGPRGVILQTDLDDEFWPSFGEGKNVPALISGSTVLLSRDPVRTAGRLAETSKIRLSGLLWPEARERFARSAYMTREGKGRGQLILFAGEPNFRASFEGTERLLINSILLGPGFGSSQPIDW